MFQPAIIGTGITAWRILQSTYDRQVEVFSKSPEFKRETDYFAEKIGSVLSAEELVADRTLLKVALGAFGLEEDLNNRFLIRKILEEGTLEDEALANQFTDPRYKEISEAFGFGPGEPQRNLLSGFAAEISERYLANSFEVAAGQQSQSIRTSLYAERVLDEVVTGEGSSAQKWYSIMGQAPLRSLFESALNLPSQFSQIDIEQQLEVFRERSRAVFGSDDPSIFADPEVRDRLIDTYLARSQISEGISVGGKFSIALTLLQQS